MNKVNITNQKHKVFKQAYWAKEDRWREGKASCQRGYISTENTIIRVFRWKDIHKPGLTLLYIIHDGYEHVRKFSKQYSQRYCVTLANQFAKEIINA